MKSKGIKSLEGAWSWTGHMLSSSPEISAALHLEGWPARKGQCQGSSDPAQRFVRSWVELAHYVMWPVSGGQGTIGPALDFPDQCPSMEMM